MTSSELIRSSDRLNKLEMASRANGGSEPDRTFTMLHAITVRQPWAHCLVRGPKRVENRKYPMNLWSREMSFGNLWLAVHVSSTFGKGEKEASFRVRSQTWPGLASSDELKAECRRIIGLVHVRRVTRDYQEAVEHMSGSSDWVEADSPFYWLIDKVIPVDGVQDTLRGQMRVWTVKDPPLKNKLLTLIESAGAKGSQAGSGTKNGTKKRAKKRKADGESKEKTSEPTNRRSKKRGKKVDKRKPEEYEFSEAMVRTAFHVINETGNERINVLDILSCAKRHNVEVTEADAEAMVRVATGGEGTPVVSMPAFLKVAKKIGLCPPGPDTDAS